MLYFAYGSNLDWEQMRKRCPCARFVGIAKLANHQLVFSRKSVDRNCGVADIIETKDREVWGVLYEISPRDIQSLDEHEGFRPRGANNAYERVSKRVLMIKNGEERPTDVQTYVANRQPNPPLPSQEYMDQIIRGACHWNLPHAYVEQLKNINIA